MSRSRAESSSKNRRQCRAMARSSFEDYILREKDAEKRAKGSLALAQFYDEVLREFEEEREDDDDEEKNNLEDMAIVVVECVLGACSHHGYRAGRFIPRLFELIGTYGKRVGDVFRKRSEDVPTWIFVRWCSQLMALLPRRDCEGPHALYVCV